MTKHFKILATMTISILLQACAPDKPGSSSAENWWRVTPVDLSQDMASADLTAEPSATVNSSVDLVVEEETFDATTFPVYRYSSLNIYGQRQTSTVSELASWYNEGKIFSAFKESSENRAAIYGCVFKNEYFTSNFSNCEGHQLVGQIGFVERTASNLASQALYRCLGSGSEHLDTTDNAECAAVGYKVEGILGYVP